MILETDDTASLHHESFHHGLLQFQVCGPLHNPFHDRVVAVLVVLGPGGMNGRAFFRVQRTVLDGGHVSDPGHFTAQGVDFPDQLPLGHAADRRAAGHGSQFVQVDGQQQGPAAHARRRQGCLAPGMPRTHHDDVVCLR